LISSDREGGPIEVASTFRGVLGIRAEQRGTDRVFHVSGELDRASAKALDDELRGAIAGPSPVVLDLREVTFIDSTGLQVLVLTAKQSALNGTSLKIVGVTERARKLFELTGLERVLPLGD
jgi:anti-sigma B factor antagonist